ncbi:molybdate ABC transporter substrate-binding protein [Pseudanabaena mucicola]|uniref:Molybdate ABC transporter substrate-binding protein n=1 Tax=Pseudanabaena mucicola FACHB-723 TaxID=2692860 RepID=A0ABR8A3C2_9CYAN|nr:molybdate ABC transporter substrate-binding protein [Pseudanabaena mucicola]MBD2189867.1 molybdate ABC transporter substrate-binding protein [Pseudanabaena mucicola FACHB-723]
MVKPTEVISFLAVIVVTLFAIAGCSFLTPEIRQDHLELTVSAAASLKETLDEITSLYSQVNPNVIIRNNFGGSGNLQQQIINGAPVDIFIAAAAKQMDELQQKGFIVADTRRNLLSNRLVLIVPKDQDHVMNLQDLAKVNERIAIGDPRSVPVGEYTEQALTKLELWQDLQPKFVLGNNVRQVLQFVESGNAQAGIVYATDAKNSPKVKVVQVIDAKLHQPIVYAIAILQKSINQSIAKSYLEFLSSEPAKAIFEKYGFQTL